MSGEMNCVYGVVRQPTKNGKIGPPSYGHYASEEVFEANKVEHGHLSILVKAGISAEDAKAICAAEPTSTWYEYFLERLKDPEDDFDHTDFFAHSEVLIVARGDEPSPKVMREVTSLMDELV